MNEKSIQSPRRQRLGNTPQESYARLRVLQAEMQRLRPYERPRVPFRYVGRTHSVRSDPRRQAALMARGLRDVCLVFNRLAVEYVVIGAQAGALHGHVRATEDIDVLVKNTPPNLLRAAEALTELFPQLGQPIAPEDIADNVVLKVSDDIEVGVSISARSVTYEETEGDRTSAVVEGVPIPFLGLRSLIRSKQTAREVDQWDARILSEILGRKEREDS